MAFKRSGVRIPPAPPLPVGGVCSRRATLPGFGSNFSPQLHSLRGERIAPRDGWAGILPAFFRSGFDRFPRASTPSGESEYPRAMDGLAFHPRFSVLDSTFFPELPLHPSPLPSKRERAWVRGYIDFLELDNQGLGHFDQALFWWDGIVIVDMAIIEPSI